ncbi:hypothetical protein [Pseudomonas aeruginosa]|uniref:hypothetical protein n=1 Tax=Pseudomonas aeruginosa TaxID=287 RepID=UPI0004F3CBB8|nr:hypothetical protein [Pseudomonas aeruginosa]MBG4389389.1 hypothetical protein [Pseudomonas aeruginosa]MBG5368196.1 hypothetical protein [Pseudomonas aeruginosa]MBG5642294.1 hypothetical protein [Pseudomonas aeruginosa]MBG6802834.1 hypothetical protein [Pseudomonas aeruginosa]MDP1372832.1 hypothetical protein [Pseudomonas aeruginosa]
MREVTELDFRRPEFRDAKVEDYEFRQDGALVRKDRWERGVRAIVAALGWSRRDFEVEDVVSEVERHVGGWMDADPEDFTDMLLQPVDIKMPCGSVLTECDAIDGCLIWKFSGATFTQEDIGQAVQKWRRTKLHQDVA